MSQSQEELVQRIAREVMAALRQRGQLDNPPPREAPAPIRPPLGTCTGDYSKFPEMAEWLVGEAADRPPPSPPGLPPPSDSASPPAPSPAAVPQPANPYPAPVPAPEPIALVGIITARQLQEAMDAAPQGIAVLAPDARLTPLAADLARQDPEKIKRLTAALGSAASHANPQITAAGPHLPWLWWVDEPCNIVDQIVGARSQQLRPSAAGRSGGGLPVQVVRDIATSIRAQRIAGAILFVRNAARAMCYANRCSSIRAVVGTSDEAVEQGIRDMGANVLVIERPQIGPRAMAAMVDRMLQQTPKAPPQVQRELADLQRT